MSYRFILFDLDGVLYDSENAYMRTNQAFLREVLGIDAPLSELNKLVGATIDDYARYFQEMSGNKYSSPDDAWAAYTAWSKDRNLRYADLMYPEVPEILAWLADQGYQLGLISSTRHRYIIEALEDSGIRPYFSVIVGGDDVSHPKPHPEPYLKGMEALGAKAEETLVVEDSSLGIRSAEKAGATVVGRRHPEYAFQDLVPCTFVIDNLTELKNILGEA